MLFLAIVPFAMGDTKVTFLVTAERFSGAGARNVVKLESRVDDAELDKFETVTLERIYEEMGGATVMGEGQKAKKTVQTTNVITKA